MPRRTVEIQKQLQELDKTVKATKESFDKEIEAETQLLESTKEEISNIIKSKNMFCGIILNKDDIAELVKIAIEANGTIKIPFNLYFNE